MYTIRPHTPTDHTAVLQCIYTVQSQPGSGLEHLKQADILTNQTSLVDIQKRYQSDPRSNFWVAYVSSTVDDSSKQHSIEVVGTIALEAVQADIHSVVLRKMYVLPQHRGGQRTTASQADTPAPPAVSLAQQLYNVALHHAKQHDIHTIYLDTMAIAAAAQRFYLRQGFVIVEHSELPAECGKPPPDNEVVCMKLTL